MALRRRFRLKPLVDRHLVEMNENAFSELLNCGQPICITRDRRAANGQLDIFDAAISFRRRCLETCEAVKARDLPQAMYGDEVRDCG